MVEESHNGWKGSREPCVRQVLPYGVFLFDQPHLACANPALELLLTGDGVANIAELLEVNHRVMRYLLVKPGVRLRLCSYTRRARSLVTPVYNTRERLAMMYT